VKIFTSEEINSNLNSEIEDLKNKMSIVEENNANLSSQLAELNNLLSQKDTELQELNNTISEKDKLIEEQAGQLEELKAKLFELQPPEILTGEITTEARVKCINCGAVGKDIKVVEDKSKVLSYIGGAPMYAKKHVCKRCGYEF
jgi:chromosome segregation ATPase